MGVSLSRNHSYTDSTLSRCLAASDDSLKDSSFYRNLFKAVYALKDKWSHCFLYWQRDVQLCVHVTNHWHHKGFIYQEDGGTKFRLYKSWNRKKINLKQLKNLNVTLIADAQFFHFLVLLENYDGRRLKHKIEFLCRKFCSHLVHAELILNFLARIFAFVSLFN